MLKSFWRTDEPGSEAGGLCSDFRGMGGRVKRVRMWREAAFRRRPGRRQLPAVWRANPAPRGGPSRCGRHSPECASSSHSTACADLAAPSSPPQTQRRERPVKWTGDATWHLSLIKITCLFFFFTLPVYLQRWAARHLAAPSLSAVWPAHCGPPWVCPGGSCQSQTPPLHKYESWKKEIYQ